jgi:hypothetical protein
MKEDFPDYHQNKVREFIVEIRQRISDSELLQEDGLDLNLKLKQLEELVIKADHLENTNRGEYLRLLQRLVLERTKCFFSFDDYLHRKKSE